MAKFLIGLIGINGFGKRHIQAIKKLQEKGIAEFCAICEINYDANKETIEAMINEGLKYYEDYRDMLKFQKNLDIIGVSTPIPLHKQMSIDIMEAGCHVLLEKPAAAVIQDVDQIIEASNRTGKKCAVDFIRTSEEAFIELKKLLKNNSLGKIKSISGLGIYKRTKKYYDRTNWAGKLISDGQYVLDGAVNNPLSHLLNNMLQLVNVSSSNINNETGVSAVTAELYHANRIEGDDTTCIRIEMDNNISLHYFVTLCSTSPNTPYLLVEGTRGIAQLNYENQLKTVIDGVENVHSYGNVRREDAVAKMYENLCNVLKGEEESLYCSIEDARLFTLAVNGAFESSRKVHEIPSSMIEYLEDGDSNLCHIKDIDEFINRAFEEKKFFSEMGVNWAVKGERFDLKGYKKFKY